jgi:hypothetical protein
LKWSDEWYHLLCTSANSCTRDMPEVQCSCCCLPKT